MESPYYNQFHLLPFDSYHTQVRLSLERQQCVLYLLVEQAISSDDQKFHGLGTPAYMMLLLALATATLPLFLYQGLEV